jgi:hypothetical protein
LLSLQPQKVRLIRLKAERGFESRLSVIDLLCDLLDLVSKLRQRQLLLPEDEILAFFPVFLRYPHAKFGSHFLVKNIVGNRRPTLIFQHDALHHLVHQRALLVLRHPVQFADHPVKFLRAHAQCLAN